MTSIDFEPETLITAMAPIPLAVARAQIVSTAEFMATKIRIKDALRKRGRLKTSGSPSVAFVPFHLIQMEQWPHLVNNVPLNLSHNEQ